jgi:hypothetical protein
MIAAATSGEITRLDVAIPFIAGALLAWVGWVMAKIVFDTLKNRLHEWLREGNIAPESLPYAFRPETIAKTSHWTVDVVQVLPGFLTPLLGVVVLLRVGATDELLFAYAGVFVVALGVFVAYLRVKPDRYGARWPGLLTTPITFILIGINLVGAAVAALIGP